MATHKVVYRWSQDYAKRYDELDQWRETSGNEDDSDGNDSNGRSGCQNSVDSSPGTFRKRPAAHLRIASRGPADTDSNHVGPEQAPEQKK